MAKKMLVLRGIQVIEGWPEKIHDAQLLTRCYPNGKEMERIRYGEEEKDWGANDRACHDCGVIKGELHVPGCDVEDCPSCGGQMITCECEWPSDRSRKPESKQPKQFSERQMRVVAARRKFRWRHTGFAPNGDAVFEVVNESDMRLPTFQLAFRAEAERS